MKRQRVIAGKYLPIRLPSIGWSSIVLWLFLDRLAASSVVQAVVWTLWALIAAAGVLTFFLQEPGEPTWREKP